MKNKADEWAMEILNNQLEKVAKIGCLVEFNTNGDDFKTEDALDLSMWLAHGWKSSNSFDFSDFPDHIKIDPCNPMSIIAEVKPNE